MAFTLDQATGAGALAAVTRKAGLSLGDRSCLSLARQQTEMFMTQQRFIPSWNARRGAERRNDLVSLLANDPATDGGGDPRNWLSNIILLIVAGVVWEEVLARFPVIEVTGEPTRLNANFVKGYSRLPVRIPG